MSKIIMETIFGSHLYGLNTPNSDTDYKGIFIPDAKDILLGKAPKTIQSSTGDKHSKNTTDDIDRQMFSLSKFISLACEGDTVAIDMIHADDSKLVTNSETWQYIRDNRHRFYTKKLTGLFGYVRKQASKYGIKGSRLAALREVVECIKTIDDSKKVGDFKEYFPLNEFAYWIFATDKNGVNQIFYEVLGRKFQQTVSVKEMKTSLFKLWEEYGDRARLAEANQGVDWKALSHALRGGYQLINIYKHGDLVYPMEQNPLILSVKTGNMPFNEVQEELEKVVQEVEILAENSHYPSSVDKEFWEDFLEEVYSEHILGAYL